jgi:hypothetical protein
VYNDLPSNNRYPEIFGFSSISFSNFSLFTFLYVSIQRYFVPNLNSHTIKRFVTFNTRRNIEHGFVEDRGLYEHVRGNVAYPTVGNIVEASTENVPCGPL